MDQVKRELEASKAILKKLRDKFFKSELKKIKAKLNQAKINLENSHLKRNPQD